MSTSDNDIRMPQTPRTVFANSFAALYESAGNPTLRNVATAAAARMHGTRARGQGGGVSAQRISDWRAGRNVPAKFEALLPVLLTLIQEARKSSDPVLPALLDVREWQRLWAAAVAWTADTDAEVPCPYPGLSAYHRENAALFFGRSRPTGELAALVHGTAEGDGGIVVLVGASGAGKSSLLAAGLVPLLAEDGWDSTILTPGPAPLTALLSAIGHEGDEDPATVAEALSRWAGAARRLLVIDQAEEVFTQCRDESQRDRFLAALEHLAIRDDTDPVAVVLAVRADFYAACLDHPVLEDALKHRSYLLGPMRLDELAEAVTRPAEMRGCELEPGLEELVVTELCGIGHAEQRHAYDPGALPLLSHVMTAAWERRSGRRLTIEGYRAAGGVVGSVAATAERAWTGLTDLQQAAAKQMLLGLITVGRDSRDTRRRVSREELTRRVIEAADAALDALVHTRLITMDAETAYLTHEIVLDAWPRLRTWLDEDRVGSLERQRLHTDAADWAAQGRDPSLLYRGARLESVAEHATGGALAPGAAEFLAASQAARRRQRRNVMVLRAVLALLCVVVVVLAVQARWESDTNAHQRDDAQFAAILAQAERMQSTDPTLSAQLSVAAYRMRPNDPTARAQVLAAQNLPVGTPLPGGEPGQYAAFRPDGRVVAAVATTGRITLWDVSDRRNPRVLGHISPQGAGRIAFSPDGRLLAGLEASGASEQVVLWDVSDPAHPRSTGARWDSAGSMAFAPTGRTLAVHTRGTVVLSNVDDPGRPVALATIPSETSSADMVFGRSKPVLAVRGDDGVHLWDVADPAAPAPLGTAGFGDTAEPLTLCPDGRTLAVRSIDRTTAALQMWDIADPNRPRRLTPPPGEITPAPGPALDADCTLAVVSSSRTMRLVQLTDPASPMDTGIILNRGADAMWSAVFAPQGHDLVTSSSSGPMLWTLPSSAVVASTGFATLPVFDRDGHTLQAAGAVWDVDSAGPRSRGLIEHPVEPTPVTEETPIPDGRSELVVRNGGENAAPELVDVTDPAHPRVVSTLPGKGGPVTVSPDGRLVVTYPPNSDYEQLWDISDRSRPRMAGQLPNPATGQGVEGLEFRPDGRRLAVTGARGRIQLWDTSDPNRPTLAGQFESGQTNARSEFAPDGRTLAVIDTVANTVRFWNVHDPTRVRALGGLIGGMGTPIDSVVFDPRGTRFVTTGADLTIRLWDFTDPARPTALGGSIIPPTDSDLGWNLAFAPDGAHLVGTNADGQIRWWDLDPEQVARRIGQDSKGVLTAEVWQRYLPGVPYRAS